MNKVDLFTYEIKYYMVVLSFTAINKLWKHERTGWLENYMYNKI